MSGEVTGDKLAHVGRLDCDALVNEHGRDVIEINPRTGGDYPFPHIAASAKFPAALIRCANGRQPDPRVVSP
jgi:carbamoyl-phosphate synthase large subunit